MIHRLCQALAVLSFLFLTACTTTEENHLKFEIQVLSEAGDAIENASVTPRADGQSFDTSFTKVDGMVDLNAMYPQKPKSIMIRAIGYKTQVVPWELPGEKPQTIIMKKLALPAE